MELSLEQQIAFDKYINGNNIFITGPGGSGKSALIKKIYDHAFSRFQNIQVTALTGCASVLLNCKAKTLHSCTGIGLGNGTLDQLVTKIKKNKFAKEFWKKINILVVDEVSMLSLKLFNLLNDIGKIIRNNYSKPFGGIQLIFSGDFFQLPPVGNIEDIDTQRFCFESDDWNLTFHYDCQIQLVKIFRQKDQIYSTILNQIREGKIKKKTNELLLQYIDRNYDANLIVEPTKLYPTRKKVELINNSKMVSLKGDEKIFKIKYITDLEITKGEKLIQLKFPEKDIECELDFLSNNLICDKEIKLKVGSQVMCIVNIQGEFDIELCNGSQGIVTKFCEITQYPYVKFNNGIERIMTRHVWISDKIPGIGVSQVPLILAWALTIHKSQGATLDAAEIDIGSDIFECGQTYVALSRVKSLDGLYLTSFDINKIRINKKVKDFYDSLSNYHKTKEQTETRETETRETETKKIQLINPFIKYQYNENIMRI